MLLMLANWLTEYMGAFQVFQYLSFRGILGVLTALTISLIVGPWMINRLVFHQIGQSVRNDGPESHLSKSGTPTMGGALILFSIGISTLLWGDLSNRYIWLVLIVTFSYGAVGWVDDYRKVVEKNSRGLPAKWKYLWQSVIALAAGVFLYKTAATPAETQLLIPFFKDFAWDMGLFYIVLQYFVIVGSSNAGNLTDGLDGLASLANRHGWRSSGSNCLPIR